MNPKWLNELDKFANSMPFGDLDIKVVRHRSKTTKVIYNKDHKIEPKNNEQAFSDLQTLINSLITSFFNGKVEFALELHGGTIKLITIKNKETKTYGQVQNRRD